MVPEGKQDSIFVMDREIRDDSGVWSSVHREISS